MSRLMSVAFTEQAVRDRIKTVTRRKGWTFLEMSPSDDVTRIEWRYLDDPKEGVR